jgi:phosphatidylserine/phosphatidylglycerophosphate/cardiolipin synthase-like enzyme
MKIVRLSHFVLSVAFISFLVDGTLQAQVTNHAVISEVLVDGVNESAAASNDEFVEIYNPTDATMDVSGWTIDYRSAAGTTFNNRHTFANGATIAPHFYFLMGGGGVANRDNLSATLLLGLGNSGGAVFLRDQSGTTIDLLGWGTASAGNYEGAAPVVPSQGISLERKAKSTSTSTTMGAGGADELEGNGYDSGNNASDFVTRATPQPQNSSSPAEPPLTVGGNGTGTAIIVPNTVNANTTSSCAILVVGDGANTLDSLVVIVPKGWTWPQSAGSVSLSGSGLTGGTIAVLGDTLCVGKGAITKTDTGKITVASVTAPDTSGIGIFIVKTALNGGTPIQIASTVAVTVIKVVHIVDIHINDSQGVPKAPYQSGATVTVSGIITADLSTTQTKIFVQDATAGVNIFRSNRSYNYEVGDSVTVTGSILQFRGLTEISPDTTKYILHSKSRRVPDPVVLTAVDVNHTFNTDDGTEPNEGRLVRINNVTYDAANSAITDVTGITGTFIPSSWTPPTGTFDLIGVLNQFKPGTSPPAPYTSDYEVLPRTPADIILHPGPVFGSVPVETDIQSKSVSISFTTQTPSTAVVKYGLAPAYTDSVVVASTSVDHSIPLTNLKPATVYHYQVNVSDGSGTNFTGDTIFSTGSPDSSTGVMNIYFTRSINPSVALAETAKTVNVAGKVIERINAAKYSIDVALYSLSGTVGANVATALLNAKNRGVKVRVVGEKDNQGTAPWTTLKNGGIPVIDDGYDAANAGNGFMHNKFLVFDSRDKSSAVDDWVWAGSWNASDQGNNNDAQNVIEIQDQALANAYTMEFNEMWGSPTDSPNAAASRFGARKTDNTPHRFSIKGTPIESYFSPSDRTTLHIYDALNNASTSINVAMLTFTRDDLGQLLIVKKAAGKKVRVVLDNNTDTGNEFATLKNGGVDVLLKASSLGGLLHHKYAVIDAESPSADNVVITGSHNWSGSAETSNNENTLIIHSKRIANLYLQEFKQRYIDAGGTDNIIVSVKRLANDGPVNYELEQNYPNPFNPSTHIQFSVADSRFVSLKVYDLLGKEVAVLISEKMNPGTYSAEWNASAHASGIYFVRLQAGSFSAIRKLVLMK